MREIRECHDSHKNVENLQIEDIWRNIQERPLTEEEQDIVIRERNERLLTRVKREAIIRQFNAEYPIITCPDVHERKRTANTTEDNHEEEKQYQPKQSHVDEHTTKKLESDIIPKEKSYERALNHEEVRRLYYDEELSLREVAQKLGTSRNAITIVFHEYGWKARSAGGHEADLDHEEIRRLYFNENQSQKDIAQELGVSRFAIGDMFRENNWETRDEGQRKNVDHEEARRLYFDKRLSLTEVGQRLGTSATAICKVMQKHGWKTRNQGRSRVGRGGKEIDHEEVRRMYFGEELSQMEVARRLGLASDSPIRRIFREEGWNPRVNRTPRFFETDDERELARREKREAHNLKIQELRENLFGSQCRICGITREERIIAIHRKDGSGHEEEALRRVKFLESVNPDEWAALCIPCHYGIHWMMEKLNVEWDGIESCIISEERLPSTMRECLSLPSSETPSSTEYDEIMSHMEESIEIKELRKALFGEDCYFCGSDYERRRLIVHRKDGTTHDFKLLHSEKYLRTLNLDDWVPLCQKCHSYVHWIMEKFQMNWDSLARSFDKGI